MKLAGYPFDVEIVSLHFFPENSKQGFVIGDNFESGWTQEIKSAFRDCILNCKAFRFDNSILILCF